MKDKRKIRFYTFLLSIIATSGAVIFASFVDNFYLYAIALLPCVVALSVSFVPSDMRAGTILLIGIISCLASLAVILYVFMFHHNAVWPGPELTAPIRK